MLSILLTLPTTSPKLTQPMPTITTLEETQFILRGVVVLFHLKEDVYLFLFSSNINMVL